jgi:hypothetical protein
MAPEPQGNRLPFEPSKKRQKPAKTKLTPAAETAKKPEKTPSAENPQKPERTKFTKEEMAVPKVVSDRMVQRMALFCGLPTTLAMATFVASYIIVSHGWFKVPNIAVVLLSMGFFGLGVLGLSYGVISASWDEEIVGSKLGWQEFKVNLGRMVSAWRSTRQKNV